MSAHLAQSNPFAVQTPEDVSAETIVSLFVDVFTDFYQIPHVGHTFLNGPRGSGKSMMFRYLEPDCQKLALKKPLRELDFFGVYIPIKNTDLKLIEFNRLTNKHAEVALSEHFMISFVAVKVFGSLLKANVEDGSGEHAETFRKFYETHLADRLKWSGWDDLPQLAENFDLRQMLEATRDLFTRYYLTALTYLKKLALSKDILAYDGPLLGYLDFFLPLLKEIKNFPFMPNGPIFLLIDDADNLSLVQTQILNGWVSSRTSATVSLKISTQLEYKTYVTASRQLIASPHDYNEVNISSVYTSEKDKYIDRVREIVERRLKTCDVTKSADDFFPPYEKQELEIAALSESIREKWETEGRGSRARDDANRYARPDYIKQLKGASKSGSTYRYAGFTQLVHLSSGIVRYFLESASAMFGEMRSKTTDKRVEYIDSAVQDKVVRDDARRFFFAEYEQIEAAEVDAQQRQVYLKKLHNLVKALGGMFHAILVSDRSERRVFSVALSDEFDQEVIDVFKLGVRYGMFHESSIGNKEGTGRARLFILSRRLAPFFTLDPTSFAGYKFMTTEALRLAMERPESFLRRFEAGQMDQIIEGTQSSLFDESGGENV